MDKGKLATQCCHAAVALHNIITNEKTERGQAWRVTLRRWEDIGAKKVVVRVKNEKEL